MSNTMTSILLIQRTRNTDRRESDEYGMQIYPGKGYMQKEHGSHMQVVNHHDPYSVMDFGRHIHMDCMS